MQHTLGHINCPACEASRHVMKTALPATLKFSDAAEHWIESHQMNGGRKVRYISPRTLRDMREYKRALDRFFSQLPLLQIHLGHFRQYQQMRANGQLGSGREVLAHKINQEMSLLVRIMKRAGAWSQELEDGYRPLQYMENDVQRSLTPEEQSHFLAVASSCSRWQFVYWYTILALHTTMSTNEQRKLRLGDINQSDNTVMVRNDSAKNKYRVRTIPLSDEARWAVDRLQERAHHLGSVQPQHYLMPFRVKRDLFDPSRSMSDSGLKKIWDEVRREAGLPKLRPYDLRHTAITRYAEAGTAIATIMAMAGHISRKMQAHYTQISEQAKRRAVENTYGKKPLVRAAGAGSSNGQQKFA